MAETDFKASVEISRKWDGEEVAIEIVDKIKNKISKPKFILLFTTIHYEKEFKKLLSGIKDAFPDSPLIGGTVAGFMTQEGCYTRGVTALAVEYPNMDVAVGIGHNVKRDPEKAVETSVENLNPDTKYSNNIFLDFMPTAVVPNMPGTGQKVIISSERIGNNLIKLLPRMSYLNMGYDRADEVIEILSNSFSNYGILGGCTMDDNKMLQSYQFFNYKIFKNSLCLLRISSDINQNLNCTTAFEILNKGFKITELSKDRHTIKEINNKKAKTAFLDFFRWKETDLSDLYHFYKRIFYYPFGFQKNDMWHTCMIGGLWGENIILSVRAERDEMNFLSLSTGKLMENIKKLLTNLDKDNINICFSIACETFIETLRDKIYSFQKLFSDQLEKTPYLVVFMAGESIYTNKECHHLYESVNILTM